MSRKNRKYRKRLIVLQSLGNSSGIENLKTKINKLKIEQKQSFFDEKRNEELKAVQKIRTDSKYFFKYANRFRKVLTSPRLLTTDSDNGELITDPVSIANKLQDHFQSVFSTPDPNLNPTHNMTAPTISNPILDFVVTTKDIIKAIDKIKSDQPVHNMRFQLRFSNNVNLFFLCH